MQSDVMIDMQERIRSTQMKRQKHILFVESEALLSISLRQQLQDEGFGITAVSSGNEALQFLMYEDAPNLIITDIDLGDMDGFVFSKEVHLVCNLPIIVVSELADSYIITEAITQFAEDYLTIPFAIQELVARIIRILRYYP